MKFRPLIFLIASLLFISGCQNTSPKYFMVRVETEKTRYKVGDIATVKIKNFSDESVFLTICADLEYQYTIEKQNIDYTWFNAYELKCRDFIRDEYREITTKQTYTATFPVVVDTPSVMGVIPGFYRYRFKIIATGENLDDEFNISNSFEIIE